MVYRRSLTFFVVFCLLAIPWFSAKAQDQNNQYFPETGHNVKGNFLRFYQAASDPTMLYGYPITEEFNTKDGLLVQYFQRARFEYHPDLPDGQRVTLTDLGTLTYTPAAQLNLYNPFACRLFARSNFPVCFAFLDFYNQYGGPSQFGYPISPFEYHDGVIVQYFQRARMEWQASNPENERVVLTDLGSLYFDKSNQDPALEAAVPPLNASIQQLLITSLQVRAFVWKAVTTGNDQQTIFIVANDQSGRPVNNAACTSTIHWINGSQAVHSATNISGIAIAQFSFTNEPSGNLIPIDVNCQFNTLNGISATSFRIWY